jgi:hypothetical protein
VTLARSTRARGGVPWDKVADLGLERIGEGPAVFAERDLDHILVRDDKRMRMSRDGGRTWHIAQGDEWSDSIAQSADGLVAWSFGPALLRSTDGGATFAKVAQVASPDDGGYYTRSTVALFGGQPASDVFVLAVRDDNARVGSIVRLDARSLVWIKQTLPLDLWHSVEAGRSGSDAIVGGTFVPGEPAVLCLGIGRLRPWHEPSCVP